MEKYLIKLVQAPHYRSLQFFTEVCRSCGVFLTMRSSIALVSSLISLATQAPLEKRSSLSLVIGANFADPAFIQVENQFYAFSTRNGQQNVPIAVSDDFNSWTLTGEDAMPTVPSWSAGNIWAPDVVQLVSTAIWGTSE